MDAAKSSSLTTGHEFWVLAVERYLLGEARVYRYDVTLCGGALNTWAPLKCLLAPHLNHLVQRNDLRAGCRLRVAQLWVQVPKLTISHLSCVAAGFVNIEAIDFAGLRIITLKELVFAWRRRLKLAPLLVRIMCKSRLQHYGKTAKYIDWPYQACFKVADSSGMMSVILWNSLCPKLFRSLEVGTVILMQQYSVKVAHHKRNHPILYYPDMKIYNEIDIYLNPWKPTSDIKVIPSKQIKPEWKLPDIKYRFITRDKLDIVPNSYICDVIGLVTFVGRCERIRKSEDSDDFWVRRFIEMVDETSAKPFILELYCTSQPEIYRQLHPVTFLVCTQMRVVRNKFNSITYLTSSHETQIYITGYHKGRPYRTDNTVKRFLNWAKLQNEKDFLESSLVGGYYSFPPLPSSFLTYIQNMKAINLTTMCQLKEKIEGLYYREHKHIVIEGIITAVRYITPAFSIGCSVYKKYTQLANTKNGANVQSSNSSTEYQDYLANNQVSEQDYFCNFHRTFQTSNQIFESKEEVTSLGRKKYNLRSRKEELFQSSILKSNSPDPDLLSSSEETEDEYFTADEDTLMYQTSSDKQVMFYRQNYQIL
ncbi:RPA-related protein RADX-like [Hemitrygon akajei]|uniref:RPA-related protein RADX-like n=1 Tax=Hemitrygon akajei TaxID=2704970 RepID=UPI003BF95D1D